MRGDQLPESHKETGGTPSDTGGSLTERQGGVSQRDTQETVVQETEQQDARARDSVIEDPPTIYGKTGSGASANGIYSPLIASVIVDLAREFKETPRVNEHLAQALEAWSFSGLDEQQFADRLHQTRARVGKKPGHMAELIAAV